VTARPCPVCGGARARPLHVRPHRRLLRCACGVVYVDPLPTPADAAQMEARALRGELQEETAEMFAAYGRNYDPNDPVVRGFERHLARLAALAPGRRLLDVGVGTGLLLHLAQRAGWEATGVDLCPEAAERAREEFGIEVVVGDFSTAPLPGGYDAITMADVLEHSRDPRTFLRRAHALLVPGGALLVAVPNHRSLAFTTVDLLGRLPGGGSFADRLYVPYHLQYFTPPTLVRLVRETGFEVAALTRENPHVARYRLAWPLRAGLIVLLGLSRVLGLEARCVLLARRGT
jgi:2-polyprenyl-3-methyl-5-hydroxy-6-metoxy-1,4-benzoquinol methylase